MKGQSIDDLLYLIDAVSAELRVTDQYAGFVGQLINLRNSLQRVCEQVGTVRQSFPESLIPMGLARGARPTDKRVRNVEVLWAELNRLITSRPNTPRKEP